jgi:pantothenate kinase
LAFVVVLLYGDGFLSYNEWIRAREYKEEKGEQEMTVLLFSWCRQ